MSTDLESHDPSTPPAWWDNWWSRFQGDQWRNIRRLMALLSVVAFLSLVAGVTAIVQQENLRGQQATTIRQQSEISTQLATIAALEQQIGQDTGDVADYLDQIKAQAAKGPSPTAVAITGDLATLKLALTELLGHELTPGITTLAMPTTEGQ